MSFNAFGYGGKKPAVAVQSTPDVPKAPSGPKMKAVKTLGAGECAVGEVDLPKITDPDEIIVQVKAVSLNPTDWKRALGGKPTGGGGGIVANVTPDLVCGCDFAGIVTEVGGGYDTRKLKVGDKVAGFIMGAKFPGHGSFSEYLKTEGTLVWKIPDGTSYEEAAAMGGISQHTAYMMLFLRSYPPLPRPDNPVSPERSFPILIWAGATACGIYCIQYAKAAGLQVVTTASPSNHQLLRSYGADACYDYNDPEVVAKIKKDWPDIRYGIDNVCQAPSSLRAAECFNDLTGGHLVVTLPSDMGPTPPPKVKLESVLVYTVLGKEFTFPGHAHGKWTKPLDGQTLYPIRIDDRFNVAEWNEYLPQLIKEGRFKAAPLTIGQGLEGITEGMKAHKEGKVKATKLVYTIS